MYGAILGDIIGSPFEFDREVIKQRILICLVKAVAFTDDSVMTIAVGEALLGSRTGSSSKEN